MFDAALRRTKATGTAAKKVPLDLAAMKPDDMTWHDYLILLLQVGAELEHALMVQYLYAAYSMGGPQVPAPHRATVRGWQETILTIAREEMGHLLAVQNMLVLLGGPINLTRQNAPWDTPFYPFPFELEPLSLASLSCYLYSEMPHTVPETRPEYRAFNAVDQHDIDTMVRSRLRRGESAHHVDEIIRINHRHRRRSGEDSGCGIQRQFVRPSAVVG